MGRFEAGRAWLLLLRAMEGDKAGVFASIAGVEKTEACGRIMGTLGELFGPPGGRALPIGSC